MWQQLVYIILVVSPVLSRQIRYSDLEDEDQHLFRAAYDTPTYDHDEYEEEDGNKMDLMKDGLWAVKAKIKELMAFDKALAAHMLSTKIKVKDLLEHHMGDIMKHHHKKEKPSHVYQPPPPSYHQQPQYPPQYAAPQYPAPQYPAPQYGHDPYYGH